MKHNARVWAVLLLCMTAPAAWAQARDASSAEEVLGPVDAQKPLDSSAPASPPPADSTSTSAPAAAVPAESTQSASSSPVVKERRAHHPWFAAAIRASLLQGLGAEGIFRLSDHFNLRGQFNTFSLSRNFDKDGVDYDGHVKLRSIGALVDYHPFAGSFRLSLGLYNDGNHINAHATCASGKQCDVGDVKVSNSNPGDDPNLSAELDMKRGVAPYFGFGWGNAMQGWPIHFAFDIGVMYQGKPNFSLAGSGNAKVTQSDGVTCADPASAPSCDVNLGSNATFQSELTKQQQKTQSDIDGAAAAKWWPSIAFTIGYRFGS